MKESGLNIYPTFISTIHVHGHVIMSWEVQQLSLGGGDVNMSRCSVRTGGAVVLHLGSERMTRPTLL